MSDYSDLSAWLKKAESLSDPELARWTQGWRSGEPPRIAGEYEQQRRRDKVQQQAIRATRIQSWVAIGISFTALVVSIFTLFVHK